MAQALGGGSDAFQAGVYGVTLLAQFDGEFASHSSTYAGTGAVRYTW